jgi:acyl carrier protein
MKKEDIFKLIKGFFVDEFELPPEKIHLDANLFDDLGLDSIDALDMVGMLEARLDIEVFEEDLKKIRTIGDVVDYIAVKTGGREDA